MTAKSVGQPGLTSKVRAVSLTKRHLAAIEAFLDVQEGQFRRSSLTAKLYALTSPRSPRRAEELADMAIKMLAKTGRIQRVGHLHWIRVEGNGRKLLSGREMLENTELIDLPLRTRCPGKWIAVDLETGQAWMGTPNGWKAAGATEKAEAAACLVSADAANR